MAVDVKIVVDHVFEVSASTETVFTLLADVPRSVSHFPDVEELNDLGDNAYEWVMKKKGPPGFEHGVRYACRYVCDESASTISWEPVDGVGNSVFSGTWTIEAIETGARIHFTTNALLSVPAPRMLRSAVAPFADKALRAEIEQYLANLRSTLDG